MNTKFIEFWRPHVLNCKLDGNDKFTYQYLHQHATLLNIE